jgi:hypothetical protein
MTVLKVCQIQNYYLEIVFYIIIWKLYFITQKFNFKNKSDEKGEVNPLTLSDVQRVATLNKFPCQGVRLAEQFRFLPASIMKGKANIS